ncbi:MAG: winged helix-turn-helix transcriptional regulator [Succinivibrionaceae bacterium]|nr:winged helix-turn-helix transcriptional regulator [Succinivibrionaceae bacterium]
MKGREIVKTIMEKTNVSNAQLAHRLGVTIATMWDRINSKKVKDIPLSTLNEMVRALDYKIVVVPASKQVKDDEYLVTNEKYDLDELLGKKEESK